jgi:transcriptional regulator with XRE-family HTH domain
MTAAALKLAIAELGMTQTELAGRLDIADRTMRRYAAGDAEIPVAVDLAINYLLSLHRGR